MTVETRRAERRRHAELLAAWMDAFTLKPVPTDAEVRGVFETSNDPHLQLVTLVTRWARGHHPLLAEDARVWCARFERLGFVAGYRSDESARPTRPVRVFRAATAEYADGMSWYTDELTAAAYLEYERHRWPSDRQLAVYERTVEPVDVLGFVPKFNHTNELIVRPQWVSQVDPFAPSPQRVGPEDPQVQGRPDGYPGELFRRARDARHRPIPLNTTGAPDGH